MAETRQERLERLAQKLPYLDGVVELGDPFANTDRGCLYKGRWGSSEVIIKAWDAFQDRSLTEAFNEAEALRYLKDLGITPKLITFGWGEGGGALFVVMEELKGRAFKGRGDDLGIRKKALDGLRTIHKMGMKHGDLSASNMIVEADNVKFIDFSDADFKATKAELKEEEAFFMREFNLKKE